MARSPAAKREREREERSRDGSRMDAIVVIDLGRGEPGIVISRGRSGERGRLSIWLPWGTCDQKWEHG